MNRENVLQILSQHREELQQQFGVNTLALFGSTARGDATDGSDIDLLVEFNRPTGLFGLINLQFHLEKVLGCPVDLNTTDGIKPRIRSRVLAESIYVN